jgi:hypothetical protein
MQVRSMQAEDAADWERMRQSFWPSASGEHAREIARFFAGDRRNPAEVLIAATGRRARTPALTDFKRSRHTFPTSHSNSITGGPRRPERI